MALSVSESYAMDMYEQLTNLKCFEFIFDIPFVDILDISFRYGQRNAPIYANPQ